MHTNPGKNLPKLDEQVGKNDKETKHQIEAKTAPLRTDILYRPSREHFNIQKHASEMGEQLA